MIWIFVVVGAVAVFAVAAVTVGREAFRLGHQPRPTIFDLDEAVAYVADDLSDEAQALLSYDEVRRLVFAELEHLRDQGIIALPGEEPERGRMLVEPAAAGNGESDSVVVAASLPGRDRGGRAERRLVVVTSGVVENPCRPAPGPAR
jgi:hypothetical protein